MWDSRSCGSYSNAREESVANRVVCVHALWWEGRRRSVMRQERLFRGSNKSSTFDWQHSARDLDVPLHIARALYLRATCITDDPCRAEAFYLRWLRDAAAARPPVSLSPVPGRRTRVEYKAGFEPTESPADASSPDAVEPPICAAPRRSAIDSAGAGDWVTGLAGVLAAFQNRHRAGNVSHRQRAVSPGG
jgi:hypothetical protein